MYVLKSICSRERIVSGVGNSLPNRDARPELCNSLWEWKVKGREYRFEHKSRVTRARPSYAVTDVRIGGHGESRTKLIAFGRALLPAIGCAGTVRKSGCNDRGGRSLFECTSGPAWDSGCRDGGGPVRRARSQGMRGIGRAVGKCRWRFTPPSLPMRRCTVEKREPQGSLGRWLFRRRSPLTSVPAAPPGAAVSPSESGTASCD